MTLTHYHLGNLSIWGVGHKGVVYAFDDLAGTIEFIKINKEG